MHLVKIVIPFRGIYMREPVFLLFQFYVLWCEDVVFGVVAAVLWDHQPEGENPMCVGCQSKRMEEAWDQEDVTELLDQLLEGMSSDLLLERIMSLLFKLL